MGVSEKFQSLEHKVELVNLIEVFLDLLAHLLRPL